MQRQTSQRSSQRQQQQQQPTHLSQAGAIASKPPPRPAASDAHGVPIQPLRFGQHLSGPDGRVVGAALPPLPARQQHVNAKSTRNGGLPAAASGPKLVDASDEFEPWPEFASNSAPAASSTASPSRGSHHPPQPQRARLPPPEILLSLFQSNLFPLPMPLFQSLVPLAFPLKRRVISDPKVKSFFEAFILAIEVAIRICAGRKRRDGRFEADKEARETARQWRALRERVAGVGLRDLPNLDASFTLRAYAGEPAELCIVCGVARHEQVRGCTKEVVWDFENGGHSTCIRWWAHEKALMES
ncbi:hypothetical protein BZA70DRAFT_235941 [Myxozyma melibiosi]|uniref:Uncharacterized protein n=1 Tax=Myxozyma melibiosi TaxID=54550 RepID=A0ABR1F9L9_9ASCO